MDYSKYILPINGALEGTGVLVGNMFITAGHVVADYAKPFVVFSGTTYNLTSDNKIFVDDNASKSWEGFDLALFRIEGIESPLELASFIPINNSELTSMSYHTVISRTSEGIFGAQENRILENLKGKIVGHYGNYFECLIDGELSMGRSGSPLLDGKKVVGILYGDKDGKKSSDKVLFLSSNAIISLIEKVSNNL